MKIYINTPIESSFEHAGFNEKHRDRKQQKDKQLENAERAEVVVNPPYGILHRKFLKNIQLSKSFAPAMLGDIVRVHDSNYIGDVKDKCSKLKDEELKEFDEDTHYSKKTWEASVYSAGALIEACKQIMSKTAKNAF